MSGSTSPTRSSATAGPSSIHALAPSSRVCSSSSSIMRTIAPYWPARRRNACRCHAPTCRRCSSIWWAGWLTSDGPALTNEKSGLAPALSDLIAVLRLVTQIHANEDRPRLRRDGVRGTREVVVLDAAQDLDAGSESVVGADLELVGLFRTERQATDVRVWTERRSRAGRSAQNRSLVVAGEVDQRQRAVAVVVNNANPAERHLPRAGFVHDASGDLAV